MTRSSRPEDDRFAKSTRILHRLALPSLILLVACAALQSAHAWETGVDYDNPIQGCVGAPMNGADALVLRIRPVNGSYGLPVLVGLKDGKTLWTENLPQAEEINAAKSYAQCKGSRGRKGEVIDVASQYPADTGWVLQRFRWDGQVVRKLGDWVRRTNEPQAANRQTAALTLVPADPKANWNIFAAKGICAAPICSVITDLAMRQSGPDPDVCGVLGKTQAKAKGIRWPVWQRQNYRNHIDEIREAIAQDNAKYQIAPIGKGLTTEEYRRVNEEYWRRFGSSILKLFETGGASYDTTEFDFDSDGVPDSLYRISMVAPVTLEPGEHPRVPADNTAWRQETCDKAERIPLFHIFIRPEESQRLSRLSGNYFLEVDRWFKNFGGNRIEVFQFDGESYFLRAYWHSASLEENRRSSGDFLATEIWAAILSEGRNTKFGPSRIQTWRSTPP